MSSLEDEQELNIGLNSITLFEHMIFSNDTQCLEPFHSNIWLFIVGFEIHTRTVCAKYSTKKPSHLYDIVYNLIYDGVDLFVASHIMRNQSWRNQS